MQVSVVDQGSKTPILEYLLFILTIGTFTRSMHKPFDSCILEDTLDRICLKVLYCYISLVPPILIFVDWQLQI